MHILPHPHAHTSAQTQNKQSPPPQTDPPTMQVDENQLQVGSTIIQCTICGPVHKGEHGIRRFCIDILGFFQKTRTFDVKSTGFLKNSKISTSLFWGFSKTRYFCCQNLGIFTCVKVLGYFTRNYRAYCDFIRRAEYS